MVSQDYIRLTPDRQSKVGTLWNVLVSYKSLCDTNYLLPDHSARQSPQLGDVAAFQGPRIRQEVVWGWLCHVVYKAEERARYKHTHMLL